MNPECERPEEDKLRLDDGVSEGIVFVGGVGEGCVVWGRVEDVVCWEEDIAEAAGAFGGFCGEGEGCKSEGVWV